MSVKPIRPDDICEIKVKLIPDYVIDAFNELIAADYTNGRSTVMQDTVVELIVSKRYAMDDTVTSSEEERRCKKEIYEKGWLNVEEIYRAQGWVVVYDKPGFNESYPARFEFSRSK